MKSANWGCLGLVLLFLWIILSWFTHIYHCFREGEGLFLLAGIFAPPLGWIHGTGIWFGWW